MHSMSTFTKTLGAASVALATTAAVAVVGLAGSELASAQTAQAPRCLVNNLSISMQQGSPGAGQRYETVTLKNKGTAACSTGGYVGLALTAGNGKALPTNAVRTDQKQIKALTLKPGQKASELLQWDVVQGGGKCITSAAHLLVTPPNDYHSFVMSWKQGAVCQNGRFLERPLYAG